jgi:hypothetical protein
MTETLPFNHTCIAQRAVLQTQKAHRSAVGFLFFCFYVR